MCFQAQLVILELVSRIDCCWHAVQACGLAHLVLCMRGEHIECSNGQPELARMSELAYTLPQRHKLLTPYLQYCQVASASCGSNEHVAMALTFVARRIRLSLT